MLKIYRIHNTYVMITDNFFYSNLSNIFNKLDEDRQKNVMKKCTNNPCILYRCILCFFFRSDSPRLLSSRSESPALPPSGPAPTLPAPSPNMNSFATSRGPSPLTLGGAEVVPLAVAFQEVIHAAFRGRDESRSVSQSQGCSVKLKILPITI